MKPGKLNAVVVVTTTCTLYIRAAISELSCFVGPVHEAIAKSTRHCDKHRATGGGFQILDSVHCELSFATP